jgi:hypothetical protein
MRLHRYSEKWFIEKFLEIIHEITAYGNHCIN